MGYPLMSVVVNVLGAALRMPVRYVFDCSLRTLFGEFCVWTLFTSALYCPLEGGGMAILMLLLQIYLVLMHLPAREKELGSFACVLWLLEANAAANVAFLIVMGLLRAITSSPGYWHAANTGLWPLILLMMALEKLKSPDGSASFWGILQLPNKWYPLFIVSFFSLLNGMVMWSMFAAIGLGYLGFKYPSLHVDLLLPSLARRDAAERKCCGGRSSMLQGQWVPAPGSAPNCGSAAGRPLPSVMGLPSGSGAAAGPSFTVFSGQGNRLGSSEDYEAALPPIWKRELPGPPKDEAEGVAMVSVSGEGSPPEGSEKGDNAA
eukprot:gnl/TRDRNA2_/TRDRNA2_72213_c0_seq1.p1 gnl/TRDRNA2_/TRDRNA2_72213_c0~~gnl/TRDRNA2_/TRDRNA2_72213_c0_seq1.p1  ORF type:complete len:362 (-),score=55.96 gnl/TRDRNA2_/TRDRNA2_72213_c0_seq1:34-990(-)